MRDSDKTRPALGKSRAQRRADRIRAFREELDQLQRERVLALSDEQGRRVSTYHQGILTHLEQHLGVDAKSMQRRRSSREQATSFLAAFAFCATAFLLVRQFWDVLPTAAQIVLLIAAPAATTMLARAAAHSKKTASWACPLGLVAWAAFVLDMSLLFRILNMTPSPFVFAPWAALALLFAYTDGSRVLLVTGILCLTALLCALAATWSGVYWPSIGLRPEWVLPTGPALFAMGAFLPHAKHPDFPPIYRWFGLLAMFLPLLALATWGKASYLTLPAERVEALYQAIGLFVAGVAATIGVWRRLNGVINLSVAFFAILLYRKFFDWWWNWMPRTLFYLALAAVALVLLGLLARLRALGREAPT